MVLDNSLRMGVSLNSPGVIASDPWAHESGVRSLERVHITMREENGQACSCRECGGHLRVRAQAAIKKNQLGQHRKAGADMQALRTTRTHKLAMMLAMHAITDITDQTEFYFTGGALQVPRNVRHRFLLSCNTPQSPHACTRGTAPQ